MTYCHTMPRDKIAITLERALVRRLDHLVRGKLFASRSQGTALGVVGLLLRR